MADAIFISYRRDDSEGEAGRLFDDLTRAFGSEAVFMDVAGIKPGVDFRRAIEQNVAGCGVLLAIIGPRWLSTANAGGARRLDDPNDFVALEIASAMKREVPVIPVLVHDAVMPAVDKLPENLKDLAFHNSVELSHARWNSDVGLLIEALKAYVAPSILTQAATVHATVPVQLPAPRPPVEVPRPTASGSKIPLIAGIALVAIAVAGGFAYFATRHSPAPQTVVDVPATTPINGTTNPAGPTASPVQPRTMTASVSPTSSGRPQAVPPAESTAVPAKAEETYFGTWVRTGGLGDENALGKLIIANSGPGLTIHAFGRCQSTSCDWGVQPGTISASNVVATFSAPTNGTDTSRTAVITVYPVAGGLDVVIQNNFQNPAGPRANHSHQLFATGQ